LRSPRSFGFTRPAIKHPANLLHMHWISPINRSFQHTEDQIVNRNGLYLIIGALLVAVIGLGVYVYREETKPAGVELKIGEGGVSIEEN
jgi:hypothetical protein